MPTMKTDFLRYYNAFFWLASVLLSMNFFPVLEKEERSVKGFNRKTNKNSFLSFVIFMSMVSLLATLILSDRFAETYYDYFVSQLAFYFISFIFFSAWWMASTFVFLRERVFLLAFIMMLASVFGLTTPFHSDTQQLIVALRDGPTLAQGKIQELHITYTKNSTRTVTINDYLYRVQHQWYAELKKGDSIIFVHDSGNRFAFPYNAVHFTNKGRMILLGLAPVLAGLGIVLLMGLRFWLSTYWGVQ